MSGRHRRPRTTPGRLALFGTVPLVGGAGLAAALAGADGTVPARNVTPTPTAATAAVTNGASGGAADAAEPVAVPGRGEIVLDAVGGARDAATRAADAQTSARVSTVAAELRDQARARAEAARAAGDAECQVPGSIEARFSRSGGLPGGFCDGVQGLVLNGRDQAELAV
ncbi:hypothetical protein [Pseudonocardia sp. HH130629-09]|uniref:hypothetical protein n=1 Tax=Pseudonocardia sp. HH130629-09 TaxID=1641402 RepID=UPI0006CB618D|nr:hypothetical protein [Pseudonocardia sp. HH130629-09]ALE83595.1 hypothetical protein XF36_10895 [Pseudonocardia sp. HH130629-09]